MIKTYKVLFEDPAIIEVEFEPYLQKDIDLIYNQEYFEELKFENLTVYDGRFCLNKAGQNLTEFKNLKKYFLPAFKSITEILLGIDKKRYPIFYNFNDWWEANNLKTKDSFNLVIDKEGFSQPFHLDNRFSMWAGSINLDNNETTTVFSNQHLWIDDGYDPYTQYYKACGTQWKGTFWLNTENNWHGVPLVKKDRRSVICNQLIVK